MALARNRKQAHKIAIWAAIVFGIIVVLIGLILGLFLLLANLREVQTGVEEAPDGRFVQAGDVEVFIQEAGPANGAPVLLVHGSGAWSEIWRGTMTALSEKGFHAIALDVPPFGYSEKPEGVNAYTRETQAKRILGVMDSLHLSKAVLVGHSVGGRPSIEAALEAPDRFRALVLVDPALGFDGDESRFKQNDPGFLVKMVFAIKPLRDAVIATFGTNPMMAKTLLSSFVSNQSAVTDDRVAMLKRPTNQKGLTHGVGDWMEYTLTKHDDSLASDFSNFSKKLTMPVFLIWGKTDTITVLSEGERLQKLIPGSTLDVIDGVGHIPYIENADAFNTILLKDLASPPQVPHAPTISDLIGYERTEQLTYLTFTEWNIVYASNEYQEILEHGRPSDFPYFSTIGQLWSGYFSVARFVNAEYGFSFKDHFSLWVIGASFTAENLVKGIYENTVGRFTELTSLGQRTAEDDFAADFNARYVRFIVDRPFYEYPYATELATLWKDVPWFGPHILRKEERRLALSAELGFKTAYGWIITFATHASYGFAPTDIYLRATHVPESVYTKDARIKKIRDMGDGSVILLVPRYREFSEIMPELAQSGAQFVDIAGNDEILMTAIVPEGWKNPFPETSLVFHLPILIKPEWERVALRVPVTSLSETLNGLSRSGAIFEHLYDY